MSKKKGKFAKQKKKAGKGLWIAVCVLILLLAAVVGMLYMLPEDETEAPASETQQTTTSEQQLTSESEPEPTSAPAVKDSINLGYGIYVTDVGSYTGMYMEDGSDEVLSDILMLVIENKGEQDVQYAEISMQLGEQTARFTATTIPIGEKMVLLEQNRMQWDETVDYSQVYPMAENVAYFQDPISLQEEQLKIGIVDGAINVTNISGRDIPGTISVYYKNAADDIYYGGITYRITIEGGLKADEIRQVMTNHASDTGSKIMFVTIAQ